jgi:hypothetical protein
MEDWVTRVYAPQGKEISHLRSPCASWTAIIRIRNRAFDQSVSSPPIEMM